MSGEINLSVVDETMLTEEDGVSAVEISKRSDTGCVGLVDPDGSTGGE